MNILDRIVETKKQEVKALYQQYRLETLKAETAPTPRSFYAAIGAAKASGQPFFISEFKRKSPSEGWIHCEADLPAQLRAYAQAGAGAISVLSDEPWFGGTYADLRLATETLDALGQQRPLLLQKDFILDAIQIYLARQHGADLILLIAAILEPDQLQYLRTVAESLGMGVLAEIHDAAEWEKIKPLQFPVVGINSRDLKTFRTALNRVTVLRRKIDPTPNPSPGGRGVKVVDEAEGTGGLGNEGTGGLGNEGTGDLGNGETGDFGNGAVAQAIPVFAGTAVVAESGIRDYRDFHLLRTADAFLIGTGLMRSDGAFQGATDFSDYYRSPRPYLFKACGLRTAGLLIQYQYPAAQEDRVTAPDFVGINFSPLSKRRVHPHEALAGLDRIPSHFVAVFYGNTEAEIREILTQYPFQTVQLYANEVSPTFVRSLKQRIFLALPVRSSDDLESVEAFASDVDVFILDGATPGSGQRIGTHIPIDFPYPFFLAGGLHEQNLTAVLDYPNCVGVDIASGIETDGAVDVTKIQRIGQRLGSIAKPVTSHLFPNMP